MSDWKVVQPVEVTNYVLNPSAEAAGNYAALGAGVIARSTSYQKFGLYSYHLQTAGNNEGFSLTLDTLGNNAHIAYLYVVDLNNAYGDNLGTTWDWTLAGGGAPAAITPSFVMTIQPIIVLVRGWDLYQCAWNNAQANGATTLEIRQNGGTALDLYIDAVVVETGYEDTWGTYCDGDQPGCEWYGASHGSVSHRPLKARVGGQIMDLEDNFGLQIGGMLGHGAAQHEQSIDRFALLPGGTMNNETLAPRVMTLTGVITEDTEAEFHNVRYALVNLLTPRAFPEGRDGLQPIKLWYTGGGWYSPVKEISAFYAGGLEGRRSAAKDPCAWERVGLRFVCPDPLWYGIGNSAAVLDASDNANFKALAWKQYTQDPSLPGTWNNCGIGALAGNDTIYAIAVGPDRRVYVGGDFTGMDGVANRDFIAVYDPEADSWASVGAPGDINGVVYGLAFDAAGDLYVVGAFTNAGGVGAADYIAQWDGAAWNAVGVPVAGAAAITDVRCVLVAKNGRIYIGGNFTRFADVANADYMTYWDGAAWNACQGANPLNSHVYTLAEAPNGDIYAGGLFTQHTAATDANYIVRYDGSTYYMLGSATGAATNGTNGQVNKLLVDHVGDVWLTGAFTTAMGDTMNYIARWNGTMFEALGNGLGAAGHALAMGPDNVLWVGGAFTSMTDLNWVDRMVRWKRGSWAPCDVNWFMGGMTAVYVIEIGEPDPVVPTQYDVWVGFDDEGTAYYSGDVTIGALGTWVMFPKWFVERSGGTDPYIISLHDARSGLELHSDFNIQDGDRFIVDLAPTEKTITTDQYGSVPEAILPNSDLGEFHIGVSVRVPSDMRLFVVEDGATITSWLEYKPAYESHD